jgi:hypothetical protein
VVVVPHGRPGHDVSLAWAVAPHENDALAIPRRRAVELDHVQIDDDLLGS